jgi:hypothetical protein
MRFSSVLCWLKGPRTSTRRGRPEPGPSRRPKRPCRPSLELLEDRCVPALFVVNTLADVGAGSLREAITFANNEVLHPGADVITFAPGVTGILRLTGALPNLTSNIDIQGPGANVLAVRRDTGGDYRIFLLVDSVTVAISGLTITNGNAANLGGGGGGIFNQGTLNLSNCTLSGNTEDFGGGIFNLGGTLTLSNCTLSDNRANLNGGGIFNQGGKLTLNNSTLSTNTAVNEGGGIFNKGGMLTLNNSTLSGNQASAGTGGGIYNGATLMLNNSTLSTNAANDSGGGIDNRGTLTLNNSTLSSNVAGAGGGIWNHLDGTLTLSNSTLSGNKARGIGAGLFNDVGGSATLTNATLTANRADSDDDAFGGGGGILNAGTLTLHNTLVAGNFRGTGTARDDVIGAVAAASSYNLVGDGTDLEGISNNVNGNQVGSFATPIDPKLGPLQNNGGPTATHALLSDSPALNSGLFPGALATDQRGFGPRTSGAGDVGAFEFGALPPAPGPAAGGPCQGPRCRAGQPEGGANTPAVRPRVLRRHRRPASPDPLAVPAAGLPPHPGHCPRQQRRRRGGHRPGDGAEGRPRQEEGQEGPLRLRVARSQHSGGRRWREITGSTAETPRAQRNESL